MYGQDILCGISKVPFGIPHKIFCPYIERCFFIQWWKFRALSSWVFLKQSPEHDIDGLVQERSNSTANALELRLSCTKPSIWRVQGFMILYMYVVGPHVVSLISDPSVFVWKEACLGREFSTQCLNILPMPVIWLWRAKERDILYIVIPVATAGPWIRHGIDVSVSYEINQNLRFTRYLLCFMEEKHGRFVYVEIIRLILLCILFSPHLKHPT